MQAAPLIQAAPNEAASNEAPYDPFSDESIKQSIKALEEDSAELRNYALGRGAHGRNPYGSETILPRSSLPGNIRFLLDKYDPNNEGRLFTLSDSINMRIYKLKEYLQKDQTRREKYSYPQRSEPNGEIIIMNKPQEQRQPNMAMPERRGGRRPRKHRSRKARRKAKKSRRNKH